MANPTLPDPTKTIPRSDPQIVRIPLDYSDIGARKDFIPNPKPSPDLDVVHVPNAGTRA